MLSSAWEFIPQQKKWELRKLETKNMQIFTPSKDVFGEKKITFKKC